MDEQQLVIIRPPDSQPAAPYIPPTVTIPANVTIPPIEPVPPPAPITAVEAPPIEPKQNPLAADNVKKLPKERNDQPLHRFQGLDGKTYDITEKQKSFCELFLQHYGNRVQAVIEAGYDVTKRGVVNYNLASVIAAENLKKPPIISYIDLILEQYGYNDDHVEKQHLFLINQYDNLPAKAKGLDMYYKLKGKYAPEKHEHQFKEFDNMSRDELIAAAGLGTTEPTDSDDVDSSIEDSRLSQ